MSEQLGPPGETCRECHAPLATDQRYCLGCGARRGDTRVAVPGPGHATSIAAPPPPPRRGANATAVAGVATLVLAMGVGVLIGRAGHREPAARAAGPPQVIRVSGGAAAAGTSAPDVSASPSAAATKSRRTKRKTRKAKAGSGHKTKATNPALKKLSTASGKDYSKQSKKLPKTLGTGGKPPPKDNRKPAGGGGFEDIG